MNQTPLKSYSDLLHLIDIDEDLRKDLYTELVNKEKNVLDVSSRIATQENEKTLVSSFFLNLTLREIIAKFAFTWQNIFEELVVDRQYDKLPVILFQKDRKIYVGIMILFIVFFLYLSNM